MNFFEKLSEADREALFDFMRTVDAEASLYLEEHRRLSPRHGEVAVGAAAFDPWLKAAVSQEYLSDLRKGKTPDEAMESAIEYGRECVKKHNEKRPKDINWQRWEDAGRKVAENLKIRTPVSL